MSRIRCNLCHISGAGYVHSEVGEGPGCLALRCAQPDCSAILGDEMVLKLVDQEDRQKFLKYARRSYVEDNRMVRRGNLACPMHCSMERLAAVSSHMWSSFCPPQNMVH